MENMPCKVGDIIIVKLGVFNPIFKQIQVHKVHRPKERYIIYDADGHEYFWGVTAFPLELEGLL
jgi:hypothetical protein